VRDRGFFKLQPQGVAVGRGNSGSASSSNPMLYHSVSGDDDLFFDAKEGMSASMAGTAQDAATPKSSQSNAHSTPSGTTPHHATAAAPSSVVKDGRVSDKLSSAIVDAWNGKNVRKQRWRMALDVSAPILVLPEDCTDPRATVLICNFGRFDLMYGTEEPSPAVLEWFADSRRRRHGLDSEVDHLKLEMNDLSFTIGSVGEASKNGRIDSDTRATADGRVSASKSVIEPISFTLDIGLEHTVSSGEDTPRTCVVGVLPGIVLRLAPSHVTAILRVAGVWASNLHKLRGDELVSNEISPAVLWEVEEESLDDLEIMSSGSEASVRNKDTAASRTPAAASGGTGESLLSKKDRLESMLLSRQSSSQVGGSGKNDVAVEFMHVSVSLLRLSVNVYTDRGDGIEAHLVSVVASSSLMTDGTSSSRISMGWFWILDRLASEQGLPRCQRLVCHSNLSRSAAEYAQNDQYASIMDDLTEQGVFKPDYAGSADLADIHIVKLPTGKARTYHDQFAEFSRGYMQSNDCREC